MNTKNCTKYDAQAIALHLKVHKNSVWGWLRNKTKPKHPDIAREYAAALKDSAFRTKPSRKPKGA